MGRRVSGLRGFPVLTMPTARMAGRAAASGKVRQRRYTCRTTAQMATYKIRDGRQEGLYSAARALRKSKVDITVIQETRIVQAKVAPRRFKGYIIRVTLTRGRNCDGVALAVRENSLFSGGGLRGLTPPHHRRPELRPGLPSGQTGGDFERHGEGAGNALRIALLPSQKDMSDEGTMDVAAETGCPGVGPEAVAGKQAGLLPF